MNSREEVREGKRETQKKGAKERGKVKRMKGRDKSMEEGEKGVKDER